MTDVDLLVAGAGGGLVAALRAAELGQHVLVVEANEHFLRGNNTAMSTAMIPGAGSRYQRALGIQDSPRSFVDDVLAKTGGQADQRVTGALAEVSANLVEWLADHVGLPIELPTDFDYPGHSVRRLHTIPGRTGTKLLRGLHGAASAHESIDLLVPSTVEDAIPDADGWRVTVRSPRGRAETISTRALLLATNGFGADSDLVARYLPEIADAAYHGSEFSTGAALRLGQRVGARIEYLDAYQGHAALSRAARTLITWTAIMHGAVLVNLAGRRFGDETSGYSEFAAQLAAQRGGEGWIILDERIHQLCLAFDDYRDADEAGAVLSAEDLPALAERINVSGMVLRAEMSEVESVVDGRRPADRFGRASFGAELCPPLRAVRVLPALFHTQGGLVVDEHARVLGDNAAIDGLYASGGAAIGMSGHGAAGYLAGNGLLPALGLAYLAAEHVADAHLAVGSK